MMSDKTWDEDILGYLKNLSNWGRWGDDDRLGTLNLITKDVRIAAARTVRDGTAVSLSCNLDPQSSDPREHGTLIQRYMQLNEIEAIFGQSGRFDAVREYVGIIAHGTVTHLDGLGHFSWDGKSYNGFDASEVRTVGGSTRLSVHHASGGIITRGVLLDIPALLGLPWLEPGHAVSPDELKAAERRQGVIVGAGDALFVYTGNYAREAAEGRHPAGHAAGLSAATLPFLRERDVALLGVDGQPEVSPAESRTFDFRMPIHTVSLVAMGLWLLDNAALDELAQTCQAKNKWEFLLSLLPWRMVGATSDAVNPVAVF
ncbi:cyclase family protein [Pseudonocardia xinjiangensis]|uniref:cyclase family protein n=1 Tax=Pseudonocardia xinjiangensis TaxID=75289 RepID=UPI003D9252E9